MALHGSNGELFINGAKVADVVDFFSFCAEYRPKKPPQRTEFNDLGSKLAARLILGCGDRRIIVPSQEEMIGVYLLERDDELPARKP